MWQALSAWFGRRETRPVEDGPGFLDARFPGEADPPFEHPAQYLELYVEQDERGRWGWEIVDQDGRLVAAVTRVADDPEAAWKVGRLWLHYYAQTVDLV